MSIKLTFNDVRT